MPNFWRLLKGEINFRVLNGAEFRVGDILKAPVPIASDRLWVIVKLVLASLVTSSG
ncbi:hypothetical protein NG794_26205 [Laspinema sp. D6]|nr:hypothetical protein [Laspinema sp. D3a]